MRGASLDDPSLIQSRYSVQLFQFNGGGGGILFSQFKTDAFPLRGVAELAAAFKHQVGVVVSLTQVRKDYAAQPFVMHGLQQIACVFV